MLAAECMIFIQSIMHQLSKQDFATTILLDLMKSIFTGKHMTFFKLDFSLMVFTSSFQSSEPTHTYVSTLTYRNLTVGSNFKNWLPFEMQFRPETFRVPFFYEKNKHPLQLQIFCDLSQTTNVKLSLKLSDIIATWLDQGALSRAWSSKDRPRRYCKCKQVGQDIVHPRSPSLLLGSCSLASSSQW